MLTCSSLSLSPILLCEWVRRFLRGSALEVKNGLAQNSATSDPTTKDPRVSSLQALTYWDPYIRNWFFINKTCMVSREFMAHRSCNSAPQHRAERMQWSGCSKYHGKQGKIILIEPKKVGLQSGWKYSSHRTRYRPHSMKLELEKGCGVTSASRPERKENGLFFLLSISFPRIYSAKLDLWLIFKSTQTPHQSRVFLLLYDQLNFDAIMLR